MRRSKGTSFQRVAGEISSPGTKFLGYLSSALVLGAVFVPMAISAYNGFASPGASVLCGAGAALTLGTLGAAASYQPQPRANRHVTQPLRRLDR